MGDTEAKIVLGLVTLATVIVSHFLTNSSRGKDFKSLKLSIKKVELSQAINDDYGSDVVIKLLDEYHKLGGNSYMTIKAEDYIRDKINENTSIN